MVELKDKTHRLVAVGRQFNIILIENVHSSIKKCACCWAVNGSQDVEQGGFPCTGSTYNGNHLSPGKVQI